MTDGTDPLFDNEHDPKQDLEELRQKIETIRDKLTGKNSEDISLEDIVQYIRAVNYNFIAFAGVMNRILLNQSETIMNQAILLEKFNEIGEQLKEFFEANSFLDDALDNNEIKDNNESNSKTG